MKITKKLFTCAVILLTAIEVFAVKLPDGQNVRSDEVKSYPNGALRSVKLREETEISTPLGNAVAKGTVYYYENGTIKSVTLSDASGINEQLSIKTNLAADDDSTGVIKDLRNAKLTFYENGSLWVMRRKDSTAALLQQRDHNVNFKTPNGTIPITLTSKISFYKVDENNAPIIHKANIYLNKDDFDQNNVLENPVSITTKAGNFILKDLSERIDAAYAYEGDYYTAWYDPEELRYGIDGYGISFYKSGAIEKLYIGKNTAKDCVLTTSLGDIFCTPSYNFPLMFWEDGSLKQCTIDDVMQVEIYGKKVQIPLGGILRFRKDGSVWAYTTDQRISFTIGKKTYTTNDENGGVLAGINTGRELSLKDDANGNVLAFNTVVLDEKGKLEEALAISGGGRQKEGFAFLVKKFYDSGEVKKSGSHFFLENSAGYADSGDPYFDYVGLSAVPNTKTRDFGRLICYDVTDATENLLYANIHMLFFGDNGFPSSFDTYETVQNLILVKNVKFYYEYGGLINRADVVSMTEDSEFIISKERKRNLKFKKRNY